MNLDTAIQYLPGVGPKRAELFQAELEISTVGDLIRLYPFRYMDRSTIVPIAEVHPDLALVQVRAMVRKVRLFAKNGAELPADKLKYNQVHRLQAIVADESGEMEVVFFKGLKWMHSRLVATALEGILPGLEETLPDYILKEKGLVPLRFALRQIHFPVNQDALSKATYRLKFEELFLLQLSLLKQKYIRSRSDVGLKMPLVGEAFNACYNALPYAQRAPDEPPAAGRCRQRQDHGGGAVGPHRGGKRVPGLHHGTHGGAGPSAFRQCLQIPETHWGTGRTPHRLHGHGQAAGYPCRLAGRFAGRAHRHPCAH